MNSDNSSSMDSTSNAQPTTVAQPTAPGTPAQPPTPAPPPSRLGAILGAVARTVSTGLAGIPDKGRPSFVTGLGEGARSAQAANATEQALKFANFDSSVKAAELHNQDLHQQNADQEASDAHEDHLINVKKYEPDNDWGLDGDTIANHGQAAITHAQNQTAANGAVTISPMARVNDDTVSLPHDTPSNNNKI